MGPYPPRVVLDRCTSPNQSAIGRWDWGFHVVRGGVNLGECRFRRSCRYTEGFMIRAWGPILPGWRWLYALQLISDWPVGLECPRRVRRCRHGGSWLSSRECRSCGDTEGFLNRGWEPILLGLRWLYAPQPISDRPVGLRFPHRARRCRSRHNSVFVPELSEL